MENFDALQTLQYNQSRQESEKGWWNKTTKLQLQSIVNMENFDALQTLQFNQSRPENLASCALGNSLVHQWVALTK